VPSHCAAGELHLVGDAPFLHHAFLTHMLILAACVLAQACLRRTVEQMGGRFGGVLFTKAWQCIVVYSSSSDHSSSSSSSNSSRNPSALLLDLILILTNPHYDNTILPLFVRRPGTTTSRTCRPRSSAQTSTAASTRCRAAAAPLWWAS